MSDSYQHHHFTTLHRLARLPLDELEAFAKALVGAGEHYLENRLYAPLLPNWDRMVATLPDIMEELEMLPYKDHKAVLG